MDSGFHFAQPLWLWGLVAVPAVLIWLALSSPVRRQGLEARYADAHLLPYLSGAAVTRVVRDRRPLLGWVLAWTLLVLAMAGPRWDFQEMNPFEPGADLVILLDISRSMNVKDVLPSRLERARQEVHDLVEAKRGISIGLVAFASVAHVVTPITDDGKTLLKQLPAISTDLVRLQGSRPSDALARGQELLAAQDQDTAHNLLLISDGDFGDSALEDQVRRLAAEGIRLHVLAVGTLDGGRVPGTVDRSGLPVRSGVNEEELRQLARAGKGVFRMADYRDRDTSAILNAVLSEVRARPSETTKTLVWNEYYYWPALIAALILAFLFSPGVRLFRFGEQGEG